MSVSDFLNFNDNCPVCGKQLTLYMHVANSALWKAEQPEKGVWQFHQFLMKQEAWLSEDYLIMSVHDGDLAAPRAEHSPLAQDSKTWQLFFFKACNTEVFEDNKNDYDINLYDVCYYRSSPFYEFLKSPVRGESWQLQAMSEIREGLTNRDETFVFKTMNEKELEKVYVLNLDHESEHTKLWYYTTTPEQRASRQFEPVHFEKTDLPLLRKRPDFSQENREKLISRFDSWILMS